MSISNVLSAIPLESFQFLCGELPYQRWRTC